MMMVNKRSRQSSVQAQRMREQGYVPAADAARWLGRGPAVVYMLIDEGKLTGSRVGRSRYVRYASLLLYLGPEGCRLMRLPIPDGWTWPPEKEDAP
jgi:hypothetical protein